MNGEVNISSSRRSASLQVSFREIGNSYDPINWMDFSVHSLPPRGSVFHGAHFINLPLYPRFVVISSLEVFNTFLMAHFWSSTTDDEAFYPIDAALVNIYTTIELFGKIDRMALYYAPYFGTGPLPVESGVHINIIGV